MEIKTGIKVIVEPDEESRALIEAHKKEKEEVLKEEKEKLDEEIQTESEKKDVKKEDKEAKPEETSEKDYKKKKDNLKGITICIAKKCNEPLYHNQSTSNKQYCMRCG